MNQPTQGLFVVGNDTEVGKTQITAGICHLLMRQGLRVTPRKPAASGYETFLSQEEGDDAILSASVAHTVSVDEITAFRYQKPLAPHLAARQVGKTLRFSDLKAAISAHLTNDALCIVEGAGGFLSPIAEQTLCSDLATYLKLPLVLVIEDRLGCINQALLSIKAIQQAGLVLHSVILNQANPGRASAKDHVDEIHQHANIKPFRIPYITSSPRWSSISKHLERQNWLLAL